jgi:hypothetical protein
MYHTRGEHANHYTTDVPHSRRARYLLHHRCTTLEASTLPITPPMYHTRGEHATHYTTDVPHSRRAR